MSFNKSFLLESDTSFLNSEKDSMFLILCKSHKDFLFGNSEPSPLGCRTLTEQMIEEARSKKAMQEIIKFTM